MQPLHGLADFVSTTTVDLISGPIEKVETTDMQQFASAGKKPKSLGDRGRCDNQSAMLGSHETNAKTNAQKAWQFSFRICVVLLLCICVYLDFSANTTGRRVFHPILDGGIALWGFGGSSPWLVEIARGP
jgi:hypothetical protein